LLLASAALAASCTVLVQFHDQASCEGGLCGDDAGATRDVTVSDSGDGNAREATVDSLPPDACNPCPGKGDGLYCGRDLAGFPAANADFLIQCQSGNVSQDVACAHGCKSSGTSSSCYP
jgi:hypothetical protein